MSVMMHRAPALTTKGQPMCPTARGEAIDLLTNESKIL